MVDVCESTYVQYRSANKTPLGNYKNGLYSEVVSLGRPKYVRIKGLGPKARGLYSRLILLLTGLIELLTGLIELLAGLIAELYCRNCWCLREYMCNI